MKALKLRLPDSLREQVEALAASEGVSVDSFISLALAEKVATLQTADYLTRRAARGDRGKLLAMLAKAPDVPPDDYDQL